MATIEEIDDRKYRIVSLTRFEAFELVVCLIANLCKISMFGLQPTGAGGLNVTKHGQLVYRLLFDMTE